MPLISSTYACPVSKHNKAYVAKGLWLSKEQLFVNLLTQDAAATTTQHHMLLR